jgi:hypothetical protein
MVDWLEKKSINSIFYPWKKVYVEIKNSRLSYYKD